MSKIVTLGAAAIGYVLGARAGRERYDQIADQARKVWSDPRVQKGVDDAKRTAQEQAPVVKDKITDAAQKVSDKVSSDDAASSDGGTKKTAARKTSP